MKEDPVADGLISLLFVIVKALVAAFLLMGAAYLLMS